MSTTAQQEFDQIVNRGSTTSTLQSHCSSSRKNSTDSSNNSDGGTTLQSSHRNSTSPSVPARSMPVATFLPTTTQFDANTGPKGVIADARSFELAKKRSFRQTLHAFADSAPFKKFHTSGNEKSKSPSPELSGDDSEDDFMRLWRQKRLDELSAMKQGAYSRRQSPSKRRYGSLSSVDPAGYLDAVEKVGTETVVVVLIYDDQYTLSNKVEDALADLAQKYATTRFVRLHYREAEMDEVAAPGILAYQRGECFANLVSFLNELPAGNEPSSSNVENALKRFRIL